MPESKHLAPKKIGNSDIIGALGVSLPERRILEMGFLWYPSGGVEAGIDGRLEIRNEDSVVTNCIVSVQSKATDGAFEGETDSELTFTCSERDPRYCSRETFRLSRCILGLEQMRPTGCQSKNIFPIRFDGLHESCVSQRLGIPSIYQPRMHSQNWLFQIMAGYISGRRRSRRRFLQTCCP